MTEREQIKLFKSQDGYCAGLPCNKCMFEHEDCHKPIFWTLIDQWEKDHPEETQNPEGQKHDDGKLDYTLLPFDALKEVVKVLEFGKKKYARDNWQKVKPKERYLQAAFRHVIAYAQGEKLDEESGLSHLAHAVCCLLFLIWKEKES